MNYLKQVNRFYELQLTNFLNANSQSLYFALLNINNKCNWIKNFTVANTTLMTFTGLNKQALYRARNNLIQKEYIKFKKGINQTQSGTYEIIDFDTASDTANDTPSDTPNDTPNNTASDTNNKLNKTKLNNKKEIKKEKETDLDKILNEKVKDEDLKITFREFMKMRKAIKKPLTTRGLELCIKNVFQLSEDKQEQIMILNNSIMNNWQGIFPLKEEQKKQLQQEKECNYKVSKISEEEYYKKKRRKELCMTKKLKEQYYSMLFLKKENLN